MEPFCIDDETIILLHDISNEELCSFIELHEDPVNDEQIELHIYACFLAFRTTHSTEFLKQAVQRAEEWVAVTADDHPDRTRRIQILDRMTINLDETHIQITSEDSTAASVATYQIAEIEPFRIDHEIITSLHNMDNEELRSFAELHEDPVNDEQIELYIYACFLAFRTTHSTEFLKQAVQRAEEWVTETVDDHPDRTRRIRIFVRMTISQLMRQELTFNETDIQSLNNQAISLAENYRQTGNLEALNQAIRIMEWTRDISGEYIQPSMLCRFGSMLGWRFERSGSIYDLNRAIDITSMLVETTTLQDDPNRAVLLHDLGLWLGRRFEQTNSLDDLNRAIDLATIAVDTTPQDHPIRADSLSGLGAWLCRRFERTGSMDDLNHAIDFTSMAVNTAPQDNPNGAGHLNNLGVLLGMRFERTGLIDDLNRAIDVTSMALDTTPQDHPNRGSQLNNLGNELLRRFERTGSIDDLNRAIDITSISIDTIPQDHPNRAAQLNNLGTQLGTRFKRTGSIDDITRAIDVTSMAIETTPQDHPIRASHLHSLGTFFGMKFRRTSLMDDLNRAIDFVSTAVDTTPQDHPYQVVWLDNLGVLLGVRFEQTGLIDDLNRAIDVTSMALDTTPQDHPDRGSQLSNLGLWLHAQFKRTGLIDDLNHAINVTSMAIETTPQDHPRRATWLGNIGDFLDTRFKQTGSIDDLDRRLSYYKEGWQCSTAPPSIRIHLAMVVAHVLASQLNWEESSLLLQEAINLLPAMSLRWLKHTDKQQMIADCNGLALSAAATALNAGKDAYLALQLLELGRGVIAGLLIEIRGDISNLKQHHPSLAGEFISLRDELDSPVDILTSLGPSDDMSSWESQTKRRCEADRKFTDLITKIHAQPGFHNFLLPPTADELIAAADLGPVIVINLSPYRSDAFLIERGRIRVLELPNITLEEVQRRVLHLQSSRRAADLDIEPLLEWLWDAVALPCLDALGFRSPITDNNWPRVWWIPTGPLSQLPLHAAGRYFHGSTETVLDRVMSSYASSVKALIYGRRHHVRNYAGPASDHALLVAMRETPGLTMDGILPFAADEVKMLNDLCPSLQLRPITPALRKDDVLKHLQLCRIFHFAGHGRSDPDPSQSCLLLEDWKTNPLTVGDLRDHRLQENPPFLGYLSACSTGANDAIKLADEGIHLVSALQLAGFRHIIGTLWEVSDRHCVDVARVLYQTIRDEGLTDVAVCRGLHRAIRELRDKGMKAGEVRDAELLGQKMQGMMDTYWVPYVHFGV